MRRVATLVLCATLLAACGQKGPLFIPDKTGEAVSTVTPVTEPASSPPVDAEAAERARQEAARRAAGN